jgi:hypothetical protein
MSLGYTALDVVGGGDLRTGCGPGPLEPDLGNASEGNTTCDDVNGRAPSVAAVCAFGKDDVKEAS